MTTEPVAPSPAARAFLPRTWGGWARLAFAVLIAAALMWFALSNRALFAGARASVLQARPEWLLVCVCSSLLSLAAMSEVTYLLMRAGGVAVRRRQALALTFSANSWSTTLPGGPALSTVLQFQVQRSWGASVVLISWFVLLSSALSTLWLAILGILAIVFLGAQLSVTSLLITAAVLACATAAIYWLATHPRRLEIWGMWVLSQINRLLRRAPEAGIDALRTHIADIGAVSLPPATFAAAATSSLLNRVFDLITLWAAITAVTGAIPGLHQSASAISLAGVALAYTSAKIVGATGVTPGGLGPVEAALTATLVGVGMPHPAALAAALIYRLISFVGITLLGWVIYACGLKEKK